MQDTVQPSGLRAVSRKSGREALHSNGQAIGATLLDFWQWSSSDLLSNTLRGRYAEFLVAFALRAAAGTRIEWDACDVVTSSGLRVEVKSSSFLQAWKAPHSKITFDIAPKQAWNWTTNSFDAAGRTAHVYVFCVLAHIDPDSIDPSNLDQWSFYVLPTSTLNASCSVQKSISLAGLLKLRPEQVAYEGLLAAVEKAGTQKG